MKTDRRFLWLWGPVIGYMAVLFILSSFSKLPAPPAGIDDKHEHFFFYGILGALTLRALARGEWSRITRLTVVVASIISGLYGVSDEFHQRFVPGRDFEGLDMIADAAGATVAALALWAWSIIRRPSDRRHVL